jgi:hypothetical protein
MVSWCFLSCLLNVKKTICKNNHPLPRKRQDGSPHVLVARGLPRHFSFMDHIFLARLFETISIVKHISNDGKHHGFLWWQFWMVFFAAQFGLVQHWGNGVYTSIMY